MNKVSDKVVGYVILGSNGELIRTYSKKTRFGSKKLTPKIYETSSIAKGVRTTLINSGRYEASQIKVMGLKHPSMPS